MKKKLILLSVLLTAFSAFSQTTDLAWVTNANNTITITGYNIGTPPSLTIPDTIEGLPVTSIGDSAFYCAHLTSVTIPNSVTNIGVVAFCWASSLTNAIIGNSVTSIGNYAFYGCSSQIGVYFLGNAPSVGVDVFPSNPYVPIYHLSGATGWPMVPGLWAGRPTALSDFLTAYLAWVTNANNTVTITGYVGTPPSLTIPYTINGFPVTSIGDSAFSGCASLTNVVIGHNVTNIGSYVFQGCSSLRNVYFLGNAPSVGSDVFSGDNNATVYCLSATTGWPAVPGPWADRPTALSDTSYYEWVTNANNTITITVNIGRPTTDYVGTPTFVTIPDTINGRQVTRIDDDAFSYCPSLISIAIPGSVTSIGDDAFCDCTSLTGITVSAENPVYSSLDGVLFNKSQTMICVYPGGKTGSYTIPNSVTTIGYSAFQTCPSLTGVTIPNSVTSIDTWAFWASTGLTNITVSAGNPVYSSLDGVLFNKSQTILTAYPGGKTGSYTIPNSVTTIGYGAFQTCPGLTSVTIPNSVTSIGDCAFWASASLASVTIPNSVTSIGYSAFYDCTGLTRITIGNSVTSIGFGAFDGCANLVGVYFLGNAPSGTDVFGANNILTVYRLAGAYNWPTVPNSWNYRPTALWSPCLLIIDGGAGSGTYDNGTQVQISADAPIGKAFSQWIGDTQYVNNVTCTNAMVTMSTNNISLTATYVDIYYTLTVNGATGSGSYTYGQQVAILANAPSGQVFDRWIGDTQYLANSNSMSTTVTMPTQNVSLTATYVNIYALLVYADAARPDDFGDGMSWTTAKKTIQAAVNTTAFGGVVRVAAGTYVLSSGISVPAGITVQGAGSGVTIVDGNNAVRCFTLSNAVVAGMTITRGTNSANGGGVVGGVISNCTLSGNFSGGHGGGVYQSTLYNCTLSSNSASSQAQYTGICSRGGGAYQSTLYNCTLSGNSASWYGGGAYQSTLYNCTLSGNSAGDAGGGAIFGTLYNCTLSGNLAARGSGTWESKVYNSIAYPDSFVRAVEGSSYNCWTNNPKFVGSGDYSLRFDSPCIGQANPLTATTNDILGIARDQLPDIGAFEYVVRSGEHILTIIGGRDSGRGAYTNGEQVVITANALVGKVFVRWAGDTQVVANPNSMSTTVTMPAQDVYLTPMYADINYTLTVNGGAGSGSHTYEQQVAISANAPASGKVFVQWVGDTQYLADPNSTSTTVTMPASNISVTATYQDVYALTVNSGAGDGSYICGKQVAISADAPASGMSFDHWAGDTAYVNNSAYANAIVTMPAQPISLTATYRNTLDMLTYTTNADNTITITSGFGDVTIPGAINGLPVTRIGNYAFQNCTSLTSITIPDSVIRIGRYAFQNCTSLTSVKIGNSVPSIGHSVFDGCTSLTNVTFGNSVTEIGKYSFQSCISLTTVTIPENITRIENHSFQNCSSLTKVYFMGDAPFVSFGAFSYSLVTGYRLADKTGYPPICPSWDGYPELSLLGYVAGRGLGIRLDYFTVIAEGATTTVTMSEDGFPTPFNLTLHATDVDGDTLNWSINTPASHGTATASGTGASKVIGYTPSANYNGTDSFVVQVSDGDGRISVITVNVTINPKNDAPVITEGVTAPPVTVSEDSSTTLTLNATDVDADVINWSVSTPASHGTATTASGTGASKVISYTPTANYYGPDSFVVQAFDGYGGTDTITVNVTVDPINDPPSVSLTTPTNTASFIAPGPITLRANASDDGMITSVSFYSNGTNLLGFGTITNASYAYTWTNVPVGSYNLTARATDNDGVVSTSAVATITVTFLPSPWQAQDIGTVGRAGQSTYATNGTFTIKGAGSEINNTADSLQYMYQYSSGNCEISLRVATLTNTTTAAKAGVMIREAPNSNAREAGVWVTPSSGILFTRRTSTGGTTSTSSTGGGRKAPYWVKLTRTDNTFKAFYSTNGITWTQFGGDRTISMSTDACMGAGVCSGNTNTLAISTMDNVFVTP